MNCAICDKRGSKELGGVLYCRKHAADVEKEMGKLKSDGKQIDTAKIAQRLKGKTEREYLLRGIPDDLWRLVKVQAAVNGTTVRDIIIEALKVISKYTSFDDMKKQKKTGEFKIGKNSKTKEKHLKHKPDRK